MLNKSNFNTKNLYLSETNAKFLLSFTAYSNDEFLFKAKNFKKASSEMEQVFCRNILVSKTSKRNPVS